MRKKLRKSQINGVMNPGRRMRGEKKTVSPKMERSFGVKRKKTII